MSETLSGLDNLIANGDIKKAEVQIAKLLRHDLPPDERSALLLRRARVRLITGRVEDSFDDLRELNAFNEGSHFVPELQELRADCHLARFELASLGFADRADLQRAQDIYSQLLFLDNDYANKGWVYYQLGRIHLTANAIDTAVQSFQKALYTPTHIGAVTAYCYERLGFITYYEHRNLTHAISFLNRAVETYPGSENPQWLVQVHLLRSRVLRAMKHYPDALNAAETALQSAANGSNNWAEALLANSEILSEIGNHDRDIVQYLNQFVQISKHPPGLDVTWSRVHEMLGNAHFNLGHYEDAINAFQSVLQFNPDHPWELDFYYRIARCHYQLRAYRETITAIEHMLAKAATEQQPIDDYRPYDVMGSAFFALAEYPRAVACYEQALQIAPSNAEVVSKIRSYYERAKQLI
jgi:tetratricopeptide (TPR) repeat protein